MNLEIWAGVAVLALAVPAIWLYNGAVKQYQTRIESFPDLIVARLLGFRPMPYFSL